MFTKKNLLYILLFSFLFITVQSAYSYVADAYWGRVKYGTYNCIKDGKTCEFERYESSSTMHGEACPNFYRSTVPYEVQKKVIADFLNSEYCKFTPTKVKKYKCRYRDGSADVYLKDGRVISASHSTMTPRTNLQDFYDSNKCTETQMEGDNGEPPLKSGSRNKNSNYTPSQNNNSINYTPQNMNNDPNYKYYDKYQTDLINDKIEQSLTSKMIPVNDDINFLKNKIKSLEEKINQQEQYFQYLLISVAVILVISLVALYKSNNPFNRF